MKMNENERFYKVYSQCVIRPKGKAVIEINSAGVYDAIDDLFRFHLDNGDIELDESNWDEVYWHVTSRYLDLLNESRYLDCGDYRIVISEDLPSRQGSCGFSRVDFK